MAVAARFRPVEGAGGGGGGFEARLPTLVPEAGLGRLGAVVVAGLEGGLPRPVAVRAGTEPAAADLRDGNRPRRTTPVFLGTSLGVSLRSRVPLAGEVSAIVGNGYWGRERGVEKGRGREWRRGEGGGREWRRGVGRVEGGRWKAEGERWRGGRGKREGKRGKAGGRMKMRE